MIQSVRHAKLPGRAVIGLDGADWRSFLQGLITQDVETLAEGDIRFGALLTPQGRLLYDLFIVGTPDGCLLDCAADRRDDLIQKLTVYRLRAKVGITASDLEVSAAWNGDPSGGEAGGWYTDPRLPILGQRGYGVAAPTEGYTSGEAEYLAHCRRLGVAGPADWGSDATYPIEADFDLLNGIDFRKGCFVGQETTSRMKRRGTIKTRMTPIAFDGPAPESGTEILVGDLRAGTTLSGEPGVAMALLRLDRAASGPLTLADGRPCRIEAPAWLGAYLTA